MLKIKFKIVKSRNVTNAFLFYYINVTNMLTKVYKYCKINLKNVSKHFQVK